jgi:hypothetical protein
VLIRLMHRERRGIETNPPMPVYKGRDGRRSGIIAFLEGEDEGSRPMGLEGDACVQALEVEGPRLTALGAVCACTSPRSRRSNGFEIIITKTRGAYAIAIIWLGQRIGREQYGLKEIIIMVCESASK